MSSALPFRLSVSDPMSATMSVERCEICRAYFHGAAGHTCHGLRTVDWVRFNQDLREWTEASPQARFELYYAARERGEPGPAAE